MVYDRYMRFTDYVAEMTMRLAVAMASISNAPSNAIIRSTKPIWFESPNRDNDNCNVLKKTFLFNFIHFVSGLT